MMTFVIRVNDRGHCAGEIVFDKLFLYSESILETGGSRNDRSKKSGKALRRCAGIGSL